MWPYWGFMPSFTCRKCMLICQAYNSIYMTFSISSWIWKQIVKQILRNMRFFFAKSYISSHTFGREPAKGHNYLGTRNQFLSKGKLPSPPPKKIPTQNRQNKKQKKNPKTLGMIRFKCISNVREGARHFYFNYTF